jgi:arginine decarboxylase
VTPGLDVEGNFADIGIPASIVTKYLAEHGVIVEKTGLYSFFIMFTIGITKGRWNTLVTELQQSNRFGRSCPSLWQNILATSALAYKRSPHRFIPFIRVVMSHG